MGAGRPAPNQEERALIRVHWSVTQGHVPHASLWDQVSHVFAEKRCLLNDVARRIILRAGAATNHVVIFCPAENMTVKGSAIRACVGVAKHQSHLVVIVERNPRNYHATLWETK